MADTGSRFGGTVTEVAVADGSLEVESLGSGPVVLLLHGWTLDRRVWAPQVAALSDRFRLVTLDRRGFGRSTAPPLLAREPEDLLAVADALGLDRFALVGMSQGARVALAFALRHAERVTALAVQGAPLSDIAADADEAIPFTEMAELAAGGRVDAMRALWRSHPLMQVDGAEAQALLDAIAADYAGRDLLAPAAPLPVRTADLAGLRLPVLAIAGATEPGWRRRVADTIAARTQGKRLDIEGAGHLGNLCRPETYNHALARFLECALAEA